MSRFLPIIGCCVLCATFGYAVGRIATVQLHASTMHPIVVPSEQAIVPTVNIDGIRNGKLQGSVLGNVRLFIGDTQIEEDSTTFSVESPTLLTNIVSLHIPAGMQFVASAKGSKYYPVSSSAAKRLSPKYRRYFRTEEDAKKAGYRK